DLRDRRRVFRSLEKRARKARADLRGRAMILERLSHWADRTPQRPFVVTAEKSFSYREIYSLSRKFATLLHERGIGKGDHVALISGNSAAFLVSWFGINAVGAVAVCLNDQLMGDSIDYLVAQSDSKLI